MSPDIVGFCPGLSWLGLLAGTWPRLWQLVRIDPWLTARCLMRELSSWNSLIFLLGSELLWAPLDRPVLALGIGLVPLVMRHILKLRILARLIMLELPSIILNKQSRLISVYLVRIGWLCRLASLVSHLLRLFLLLVGKCLSCFFPEIWSLTSLFNWLCSLALVGAWDLMRFLPWMGLWLLLRSWIYY